MLMVLLPWKPAKEYNDSGSKVTVYVRYTARGDVEYVATDIWKGERWEEAEWPTFRDYKKAKDAWARNAAWYLL